MATIACQSCTFLNPAAAFACTICNARLPKARARDQVMQDAAAKKRARDEAAQDAEARKLSALPKTTLADDGYVYRDCSSFATGWADLVERAACAAEAQIAADGAREKGARKL